jgi:cyclophilin family peptidyl-prolyl cis-trans isomerase
MHKTLIALAALAAASPALPQASAAIAAGKAQPSPLAPSEIVAAAPKADWTAIATSDLLVMDLAPDAKGKPRRVVIQLMPAPFSQGWIGNIRKLAAAKFWDGTSVNRVQDNYVVQWGDATEKKPLPEGLADLTSNASSQPYIADPDFDPHQPIWTGSTRARPRRQSHFFSQITVLDRYGSSAAWRGWPIGFKYFDKKSAAVWPIHCYGMVGVGRDMPPNTGTGAELYVVIGHAPRHLDRNIALVGRVIEGIEHLSSLPRGHGALGFYDLAQGDERTAIQSIRLGSEVKDLPAFEYLSTESGSFARYADARANRRDAFFIRPAGGADICNIPVPVRRAR